jgi:hypothetical protein
VEQLMNDKYIGLKHPYQTTELPADLMHNLHASLAFDALVYYGNQLKQNRVVNGTSQYVWNPALLTLLEGFTKDRYEGVKQEAIFYKLD